MEGGVGLGIACHGVMVPFGGHTSGSSTPYSAGGPSTSSSLLPLSPSSAACSVSLQSSTEVPSPADVATAFLSQQLPYAHLLDTLPYVDALSPEQHEAAKLLVQQEMAAIRRESRSGRRWQQQQSESQQQHKDSAADEERASVTTSLETSESGSAAAVARPSVAGQQETAGESDANAEEELLLQSYLRTFPLPPTPHLDDPNTLAGRELARLARGEPLQKLDFSRYEALPSPPAAGNKAQESEWRKSVDNCEGLLEHLGVGQTNLELMNLHAISLWMRHLHGLTIAEQHWAGAAKRLRNDVDCVSKQRKLDQVECSSSLRDAARMREDYEHRNEEILAALGKLQEEVVELKLRCQDRGVLPDDYDSDFDEDLDDWEALASSAAPAPAPDSTTSSSSSSNRNSSVGFFDSSASSSNRNKLDSSSSSSTDGSSRNDEMTATQTKSVASSVRADR